MFKSLCLPSKVYFVLSFIGVLISILSPSIFGGASFFVHLVHLVYFVFWTWVLNLICKAGYKWISWVLVLAPFLLAFFIVAFSMNSIHNQPHQDQSGSPVIVLSQ
jgi:hypothetical protein